MGTINTVRRKKKNQPKSCFLDLLRIIRVDTPELSLLRMLHKTRSALHLTFPQKYCESDFLGNVQSQLTFFFLFPVFRLKNDPELSWVSFTFFFYTTAGVELQILF